MRLAWAAMTLAAWPVAAVGQGAAEEQLNHEVAGWTLRDQLVNSGPDRLVRMERTAGEAVIEYQIDGGKQRTIIISRYPCPTKGEMGKGRGVTFFVDGPTTVEALRQHAEEARHSLDADCSLSAAALDGAFSEIAAALPVFEDWVKRHPVPASALWTSSYSDPSELSATRQGVDLQINYTALPEESSNPGRVQVTATTCEGREDAYEQFDADVEQSGPLAENIARVSAVILRGVAELSSRCKLKSGLGPLMIEGFEAAIVRFDAERRQDRR